LKAGPTPVRTALQVALLTALAALWFVPLRPELPSGQLDSNWRLGLSLACEQGLAFGQQIVFTFGPLGCLVTWQYWPSTYLPSVAFWLGIAAIAGWLVFDAMENLGERMRALLALLLLGLTVDSALLVLPLAFVLHGARTRSMTPVAWLACLALGPLALTKFTLLPLCVLALAAGLAVRDVRATTRLVGLVVACVGALVALLAAGQPLDALLSYLFASLEITRHYPDAMHLPAEGGRLERIGLALGASLAAGATVAGFLAVQPVVRSDRNTIAKVAMALFVVGTLAVVFRHGTTRGDAEHVFPALVSMMAFLLLWFPRPEQPQRPWALAAVLSLLVLAFQLHVAAGMNIPGGSIPGRVQLSTAGVSRFLDGSLRRSLDDGIEDLRGRIRAQVGPSYPLDTSVDVLSYDQHLVLVGDPGSWRPRPVFQSYQAYSAGLAMRNARFLRSDHAPQTLLVAAQTIDRRLPTLDDAASWEIMRTHYRVAGRLNSGHLILDRRKESLDAPGKPENAVIVEGQDWTTIPAAAGPGLYASIRCERSVFERLVSAVWKPPSRFLEVRLSSGVVRRFRLVGPAAEAGFLLSPLVLETESLRRWLEGADVPLRPLAVRVVDNRGRPLAARFVFGPYPYPRQ